MKPNTIYEGDCIETMKQWDAGCVQTCITSPPYYGLRDYGHEGQIGLEETPEAFVAKMVEVFREVKRVLRDDGTLWLNLGDSYANQKTGDTYSGFNERYSGTEIDGKQSKTVSNFDKKKKFDFAGLKPKDLIGIPWMVAFALRADGWYLRQDIIWHKPNPMPESVTDRCTKAHEYIFLFSKSQKYHFDNEAIKEDAKYGVNGEDSRPAGVVREREYDYDSKRNNNPSAFMAKDKRAGKGRISYEGKRTIGEASANGQQSFVTINEKRNKRSVWTVTTKPYSGAHFATFPPDLIEPCILAGAPEGGIVLDPFMGSGTTAHTALRAGRQYVGCELNGEYIKLANKRLSQGFLL
jgi:DNA modification methylase